MSEDLMRAEEMYNAIKEKEELFDSRRWAVVKNIIKNSIVNAIKECEYEKDVAFIKINNRKDTCFAGQVVCILKKAGYKVTTRVVNSYAVIHIDCRKEV